jgi:integration host factor subunit beta
MTRLKNPTYTKLDVATRVSERTHSKLSVAEEWTDDVFSALRDILESADPELRIEIRNFGVFEVKLTRSKPRARNPKTGEEIFVPARKKTHFKPGKRLREFLRRPLQTDAAHNQKTLLN